MSRLGVGYALLALGIGCTPGTEGDVTPSPTAAGPYSLHCGDGPGPAQCVRFHAPTGRARRMDVARLVRSTDDPEAKAAASVYTLTCGQWQLGGEGSRHAHEQGDALHCLRLDTYTGEVTLLDAESLPSGL